MPQVSRVPSTAQTGDKFEFTTLSTLSNQRLLKSPWAGEARARHWKAELQGSTCCKYCLELPKHLHLQWYYFFPQGTSWNHRILQPQDRKGPLQQVLPNLYHKTQQGCKHLNVELPTHEWFFASRLVNVTHILQSSSVSISVCLHEHLLHTWWLTKSCISRQHQALGHRPDLLLITASIARGILIIIFFLIRGGRGSDNHLLFCHFLF